MNRFMIAALLSIAVYQPLAMADACPDPDNSSLKWGEIPTPWRLNPVSPNAVQGEIGTRFVRANILVAGFGQGVMCTYRNSIGDYSIWWQTPVHIPARSDYNWIAAQGGFFCGPSRLACQFHVSE